MFVLLLCYRNRGCSVGGAGGRAGREGDRWRSAIASELESRRGRRLR